MKAWLQKAIRKLALTQDVEEYALSRGATPELLTELQIGSWVTPEEPCPNAAFAKRYGSHGQKLRGRLIAPYFSPWGEVVGFEARNLQTKFISDIRLPEMKWCPIWLGLTTRRMEAIWDGCDIWLVEGLFDLVALRRVVPEHDAVLASVTAMLGRPQFKFISRFMTGRLYIVYDQDDGGKEGSRKVQSWMRSRGVRCQEVLYRGGSDPGEIWDRGGQEALNKAFWFLTPQGDTR